MDRMRAFILHVLLLVFVSAGVVTSAGASKYPEVVIYSTPWCASCKAAMDYMTQNNIPFTKKDIDVNKDYLEELGSRYKSRAVPVIVIGNDERVLKGFVVDVFQKAFRDVVANRLRGAGVGR